MKLETENTWKHFILGLSSRILGFKEVSQILKNSYNFALLIF
jgi:hypothetical protein